MKTKRDSSNHHDDCLITPFILLGRKGHQKINSTAHQFFPSIKNSLINWHQSGNYSQIKVLQ